MRVRVRLFASFAQAAGFRERELELAEGAVAGDALAALRRGPLLALPAGARPLLAVNRQHSPPDTPLSDGDEVAIFPPVSGGSGAEAELVRVTVGPLDPRGLAELVRSPACGALVTFEGTVRDHNAGEAVSAITYEAHEDMAREVLAQIVREAQSRWPQARIAIAHRTGRLEVGEVSLVVCVAAPHRRHALAACRHAIDRVKEILPAWKREERSSGTASWL